MSDRWPDIMCGKQNKSPKTMSLTFIFSQLWTQTLKEYYYYFCLPLKANYVLSDFLLVKTKFKKKTCICFIHFC